MSSCQASSSVLAGFRARLSSSFALSHFLTWPRQGSRKLSSRKKKGLPISAQSWASFLDDVRVKTRAAYKANPRFLESGANQRIAATRDYHGREVLELLQNSDDQAERSKGATKVVHTVDGLCFANKGNPFTREGVESLTLPGLSPKEDPQRYIGNKGIGFRSILNWTKTPIVLSANLRLAFSPEFAEQFLASVPTRPGKKPDPLAVPFFLTNDTIVHIGEIGARLLVQAEKLRKEGYDTVIALPFSSQAAEGVEKQLADLTSESLLFLNSTLPRNQNSRRNEVLRSKVLGRQYFSA